MDDTVKKIINDALENGRIENPSRIPMFLACRQDECHATYVAGLFDEPKLILLAHVTMGKGIEHPSCCVYYIDVNTGVQDLVGFTRW